MRAQVVVVVALSLAGGSAFGQVVNLGTEAAVKDACEGLRPTERVAFPGSQDAQAAAREKFEARREVLEKQHFGLDLAWGQFAVSDVDPETGDVVVSTEKPFRAHKGAFTFFDADRDSIELTPVEGREAKLKAGLAKGTVTLTLVFKPSEDDPAPCTISKAPAYTMAVDLLSAELRVGGVPVARAEKDDFVPLADVSATQPQVEVRSPTGDDAGGLVTSVMKVKPAIERCYADGLTRNPGLDGALVLNVEVQKDGKLQASSVVADTVQDDAVAGCVKTAVGGAQAAKGSKGMVAIHLARK